MNVLIINRAAGDVPLRETFLGTLPFVGAEVLRVLLLVAFPGIVLFLPRLLS
jgi:TRAP-type C4-dicarboxylate transport system permease large subunit